MEKEFKHEIQEIDNSVNPVPENKLHNIVGNFEVVSSAPTGNPTNFQNQIKIYSNGSTYRLYWYDTVNHAWRYASGT